MLDIAQIKQGYHNNLHQFERGLLREYLQYQLLSLIFQHPISRKLSFLGGTNLRLVYGLPRFSEDIGFDSKNLSLAEFTKLSQHLQKELNQRGYLAEIHIIDKSTFHCYIKFPHLLYQQGLSLLEEEKILIQVDSFDQGVAYQPEVFILSKFEFFDQILTTPKPVILSQKLWTITQRKRLKGRDLYDTMFLLQNTQPDPEFLAAKFGTSNHNQIKKIVLDHLGQTDFATLAKDVRPFLHTPSEADKIKLFPDFLKQQL